MKALWVAVGAIVATLTGTAILGDMVSEEIRGRLDRLPYTLIALAVRRVPADVRKDLAEEWIAELHVILRGAEALPVTRLYRGIRYALGLLRVGPSIGRVLSTSPATPRAFKANDIRRQLGRFLDKALPPTSIISAGATGISGLVAFLKKGDFSVAAGIAIALAIALVGVALVLMMVRRRQRKQTP